MKEKIVRIKIWLFLFSTSFKTLIREMKEFTQIKEILRTQAAIERELRAAIKAKIPEVARDLVAELFVLIKDSSKDLRLALQPCIAINYVDARVYIRILPIEAGPKITREFDRKKLFPSHDLAGLFELREYELYDKKYCKELCHELAEEIRAYLSSKEVGCRCSISQLIDKECYGSGKVEYTVIPKI